MKDEIIIYQANQASTNIEVRLHDETVWLNRNQIALLFGRDVKTIGKHILAVLSDRKSVYGSNTNSNLQLQKKIIPLR